MSVFLLSAMKHKSVFWHFLLLFSLLFRFEVVGEEKLTKRQAAVGINNSKEKTKVNQTTSAAWQQSAQHSPIHKAPINSFDPYTERANQIIAEIALQSCFLRVDLWSNTLLSSRKNDCRKNSCTSESIFTPEQQKLLI